jgi:hypothetical protein
MRKADTYGDPPTLAEVVHRAVEVADPEGTNDAAAALLERFEDRDEPVTAAGDVEEEIAEAKGAVDPQDEDPVAVMAAAVATYLAFRRTELEREREELLALAARAALRGDAFGITPRGDGKPPETVAGWLAAEGVEV